jgi:hypothetical protein
MSNNRAKFLFVVFAVAALALATLIDRSSVRSYRAATMFSFPILTEKGTPIASVFSGAMPSPDSRGNLLINSRPAGRLCESSQNGILTRVRSWFQTRSVQAQTCAAGSCGSHYIYLKGQSCGFACGNNNFPLSDSERAGYCDGWKYTGNDACFGCSCEMEWCPSC